MPLASLLLPLALAACSSVSPAVKEGPSTTEADATAPSDAHPSAPAPDAGAPTPDTTTIDASTPAQPTCTAPEQANPEWYREAVGYEIFVRSFKDSDDDGKGDIAGLIDRLDYLNDGDDATDTDLGVTLLWLMPIMESPSYHGYDTTNYRAVEPDYGTLADLDTLMAAAHARGIKVVLDLVLNHSSSQHPWFVDAKSGPGATHRDWYVWSDEDLGWKPPWGGSTTWHEANGSFYYALFWEGMPDLNYATADVRAEMRDVALFWLGHGADGFRLDAARYLVETGGGEGQADTPETHAYWQELRAATDAARPGSLLVGEVWEATSIVVPYFGTAATPELQMLFDFDGASGIVDSVAKGSEIYARSALCKRLGSTPPFGAAATFLTNHDRIRVASALSAQGDGATRLAAAMLLTWPGTPWLYYGEEIGMRNGKGQGDEAKRLPMQWSEGPGAGFTTSPTPWQEPTSTTLGDTVAGQSGDPASLLSLYRDLIRLRAAHPALRVGSTRRLAATGTAGTPLALLRTHGEESMVLVYSFAAEPNEVTLSSDDLGTATSFEDALSGEMATMDNTSDSLTISLEPRGFRVLVAQ